MTNKPPLPTRKNTRWDKQDYSHPGEYMITICVRDMKQILSKIVPVERGVENSPRKCPSAFAGTPKSAPPPTFHGITEFDKNNVSKNSVCLHSCDLEQTVGDGALDRPLPVNPQTVGDDVLVVPHTELTNYGQIADKYINQLNDFYKNINVLKYVIMPNHIHLLLQIPDNGNGTTGTSSPTKTTDGTKCEITPSPTGSQTDVRPVEHSVISNFVSTFKRFCHREIGEKIFQRSFHDHVIRDENDLIGAINYIENNPYRWIDKS